MAMGDEEEIIITQISPSGVVGRICVTWQAGDLRILGKLPEI
jgi:hypothetical protein